MQFQRDPERRLSNNFQLAYFKRTLPYPAVRVRSFSPSCSQMKKLMDHTGSLMLLNRMTLQLWVESEILLRSQLEFMCEQYKPPELRTSSFEDSEQIKLYCCSNLVRQFLPWPQNFDYVHDSVLTCTAHLFCGYKAFPACSQKWTCRLITTSVLCLLSSFFVTEPCFAFISLIIEIGFL